MCGIVGIVDSAGLDDPGRVERMRDTLCHRGPDDAGSFVSADRRVALGHRRLSIIDLSPGGHQPMLREEGGLAIVFNGEIYNHRELRDELARAGASFRSTCDTEVLLEAYRRWGDLCLEHLDGMFAFAVYDAREQSLLLARDRAGEKPLFYWHDGGRFEFASELKALLAGGRCPRRIDSRSLREYMAYGYVMGDRCMLAGVRKLPAGCAMRYDLSAGRLRVRRYWDLPAEPPADLAADSEPSADRLESLLAESVRRRMIADVPVGILLSGGIDSSLVTAMAARTSERVKTYTITFPGYGGYDEGPYARRVAEHFGTEHTELVAEPASVELLPQLARQYDEPMADSSMIPTYLVSRLIRRHCTVALGGDGGDELFGGYPPHQWVLKMRRLRRFLPLPLRGAMRAFVERFVPLGRFGRNAMLGLLGSPERSLAQVNLFFDELGRSRLLGPAMGPEPRGADRPEAVKLRLSEGRSLLQRITRMDFRSYLVDDILVKVDRASMLNSLEVRAPILAPEIIEFAYQLPDALRATRREKKILPRRLAARLLPADMDLTRKQGFSLPLEQWFAGRWGEYCREVLIDAPRDMFRREAVEELFIRQRQGYRHAQRIFALTMLELWRRAYDIALPEGE